MSAVDTHMLFVNRPVADVAVTRAVFGALGFGFDRIFCDAGTLCMDVDVHTKVMLHDERRFAGYAASRVADPLRCREVVLAISAESRAEVDRRADAALAHGGALLRAPEDLGFMYSRSFCDPDGHAWEVVWMDPSALTCGNP